MKTITPDYYNDFVCAAGQCKHTCCAGWEIDIDDDTLEYYKTVGGEIGEKIRGGIGLSDGTPSFILRPDESCPFLNGDGLCDIIVNLGENALCQICADHPRFRNFYSDRTEIGLGLCCEAAAKLILGRKDKVRLIEADGKSCQIASEDSFFRFRERLFGIIQNRSKPIQARALEMFELCGVEPIRKTPSEWARLYIGLERLDGEWTDRLSRLRDGALIPAAMTDEYETALEQLIVYFLFRHLSAERIAAGAAFAVYSAYVIYLLSEGDITDTARMYSAEIEYSEENTKTLTDLFDGR